MDAAKTTRCLILFSDTRRGFDELARSLRKVPVEHLRYFAICVTNLEFLGVFDGPFRLPPKWDISLEPKLPSTQASQRKDSVKSGGAIEPPSKTGKFAATSNASLAHQARPCSLFEETSNPDKLRCRLCSREFATCPQSFNHLKHLSSHHIEWSHDMPLLRRKQIEEAALANASKQSGAQPKLQLKRL